MRTKLQVRLIHGKIQWIPFQRNYIWLAKFLGLVRNRVYQTGHTMVCGQFCFWPLSIFGPIPLCQVTELDPIPGPRCGSVPQAWSLSVTAQWWKEIHKKQIKIFPWVLPAEMQPKLPLTPFTILWRVPVCRRKPSRDGRDRRQISMRTDLMALPPVWGSTP